MTSDLMAFPAVGGRLALDFVATLGKRGTLDLERLREPSDLSRWGEHAGIGAVTGADDPTLAAARELREALYRWCKNTLGHRTSQQRDVVVINVWARRPPPPLAVAVVAGQLIRRDPTPTAAELLASVARDAVDLLAGADAGRVRECGRASCTLLFVDASRGRRRRWCSMDTCGAQAKMQTLRAKRRSLP